MAQRSLNKAQLIGNLTRDPELRYTPKGTAVCTFGLATNRSWTTETGERKEDAEFHRLVAWNKLAELCSQLLFKGRRVYVEGRLQTRRWNSQDGTERQTTEIVIDEMMILDSKRFAGGEGEGVSGEPTGSQEPTMKGEPAEKTAKPAPAAKTDQPAGSVKEAKAESETSQPEEETPESEVKAEDIPF